MVLLASVIAASSEALEEVVAAVLPAQLVPFGKGHVFRYIEQTLEQAIVQKLARVASSLNAVQVLMEPGLYQEVGVIFRVLDELTEDIHFLCLPLLGQPHTPLHDEYLEYFYREDRENPNDLTQPFKKRETVKRSKIHSALGVSLPINHHDGMHIHNALSTLYSGYVHAASPHVMDAYGGMPARFHVSGMRGTPREASFERESITYAYRALHATMLAALALGKNVLAERLLAFRSAFEQQAGMTSWKEPEKMMRELKAKGKAK